MADGDAEEGRERDAGGVYRRFGFVSFAVQGDFIIKGRGADPEMRIIFENGPAGDGLAAGGDPTVAAEGRPHDQIFENGKIGRAHV